MDAALERKTEAINEFLEHLLGGPAREYIARVILHGSVAEGLARPESDIDLLVFELGHPALVADACDEASFETLMKMDESVEPLVYPASDYRYPPSYFVYRALQDGREVYSMNEKELKQTEEVVELADDLLTALGKEIKETFEEEA